MLFALKLSGPPIGPITRESVLKARPESLPISIFAQWAADELDKWNLKREMQNLLADKDIHRDGSDDDDASSATLDTSDDEEADPDFVMGNDSNNVGPERRPGNQRKERYTAEEKQFLKRNWKTEWKFLQLYGLDMKDEKARDLGRDILRGMMEKDKAASNTRLGGFTTRTTGRKQPPRARKVLKRSGPRAQKVNKTGPQNGFLTATLGKYRVTRAPTRVGPQRRMGAGRLTVIKEERT